MHRYKLTIEYCGAGLAGWQRQHGQPSVQQHVEEALRNLDSEMPSIIAAGRTDAGVHAMGQVAHCDLQREWDPYKVLRATNHFLKVAGTRIAIIDAEEVDPAFNARFSATARHYRYRIIQRPAPLALEYGMGWQIHFPLDIDAMRAGAAQLIGKHDFTTFRSVQCQSKSPVKTLDSIEIEQFGDEIRFSVRARSFLHNQVRSLVGTLERVGAGRWSPEDVGEALAAADRSACGPVAPPQGLFLERVLYSPSSG